jgi:ATP-dependent 26S proteasome regulatory subunit
MIQVVELPLTNPELFQRVGITPPKGCLLFGPPGKSRPSVFHFVNQYNFRHGKNFISPSSC